MQGNGWFTEHIKRKLLEANKCLYVLRRLRKEEYNQVEIDHLFQSLVLPKISYVLLVYAASVPELNTVQQFLRRCHKRRFISYAINIYDLLEKTDRSIFKKISCLPTHLLCNLLPRESSKRLRIRTRLLPCVNEERFKASFINRRNFKSDTFTFSLIAFEVRERNP